MERLQKYIARSGVASRRKAEDLIRQGLVKVNGEVITEMGYKVDINDQVEINNKILDFKEHVYLVMNKPRGIISTTNDEKSRKTVITILPDEYKSYRLFPVGRLDCDTKGVLILTNDGEFMNTLVGPKSLLEKEYLVRVSGIITKEKLNLISNGLNLGDFTTRKCITYLKSIDKENNSSSVGIIIKEGKYHQVKRMFESVGYPVKHLTRIRFGEITTNGIAEGEVRPLTPHEIKRLVVGSKQIIDTQDK